MINNTVLVGRITKDIELKTGNSGKNYCNFTLAVNRPKAQDGSQQTDFINCKAFNNTATALANYCGCGSLIGVEGSIQTGSYQGKDGKTVYTTDIAVRQVHFLDTRNNQNNQQGGFNQGYNGQNNGFQGQQPVDAMQYINQQNNSFNGQNNQQQMEFRNTGIKNNNNIFDDFGSNFNIDPIADVVNPFKEK